MRLLHNKSPSYLALSIVLLMLVMHGEALNPNYKQSYSAAYGGHGQWYMRRYVPYVVTAAPTLTWLRRPVYRISSSHDRDIENVMRSLVKHRQRSQNAGSNHIFLRMG